MLQGLKARLTNILTFFLGKYIISDRGTSINMEPPDIFISYSHLDSPDFARALGEILKKRGFRVWIDESSIGVGDHLYNNIVEAIKKSGLYIAVISKGFCDVNRWAYKEFKEAINEENSRFENGKQKRFIVPILYNLSDLNAKPIKRNKTLARYLKGKLYIGVNLDSDDLLSKYINDIKENIDITEPDKIIKIVNQIAEATGLIEDQFVKTDKDDLEISRFPVTNLEFKRFINAGGYTTDGLNKWWSEEGKECWYAYARRIEHDYLRGIRTEDEPIDSNLTYSNLLYNYFKQPVTGVNYYEAQAYCKWLNEDERFNQKYIIRMPTQEEWFGALTNYGKSKFPWGDTFPNPEIANLINEKTDDINNPSLENLSIINTPNYLGKYHNNKPNNYDCHDLIGNVWEWVNDFAHDDEIKDEDKKNKVKMMGNCCFDFPSRINYPPIAYRYPGYRHPAIGFRLIKQKIEAFNQTT